MALKSALAYGGRSVAFYGNAEFTRGELTALKKEMAGRSGESVSMLDAVHIKNGLGTAADYGYTSAIDKGVMESGAEMNIEGIEKLNASQRSKVNKYLERYPSVPLHVIANETDIDALPLGKEAQEKFKAYIREKNVEGAYCVEDGNIYIFANVFDISGDGTNTLMHENVHAVIDELIKNKDEKEIDYFLMSYREALLGLHETPQYIKGDYEKLTNIYPKEDVEEEFLAFSLPLILYKPIYAKLQRILTLEDWKTLENIKNKIAATRSKIKYTASKIASIRSGSSGL